ncbi:glycosyltransferase [Vibrio maritimus]|uniref:glycosyltransferase n=1 Tax=Vibrio maritimus TaxID=990268 RepID=UPI0037356057
MNIEQVRTANNVFCGCVVWYNPQKEHIYNILTYIEEIETLYIVDNSSHSNEHLLNNIPSRFIDKVNYIRLGDNRGIARALNIAFEHAIIEGFSWVLTMDQDSKFPDGVANKYFESINSLSLSDPNIAIFAPRINFRDKLIGYVESVITSGNVVSTEQFSRVGGFDNDLFIDQVDHDFCFKLRSLEAKIFKLENVVLEHQLGDSCSYNIFGREFRVMHHNSIRKYYIIRNRCVIKDRYPDSVPDFYRKNISLFIGVLLFEKNKFLKIRHMIKGYFHYRRGVLGPMK